MALLTLGALMVGLVVVYLRAGAEPEVLADAAVTEIRARGRSPSGLPARGHGDSSRPPAAQESRPALPPIRLSPARSVDDPGAPRGALAGRVLSWADGSPIGGAELIFATRGQSASVRADSAGTFEYQPSEIGEHVLSLATAPGFHPYAPEWDTSPLTFRARRGRRVDGIVVYLVPARPYVGVVVDATGEPVAGAVVRLRGRGAAERVLIPAEEIEWRSDAQGGFTFRAAAGALLEGRHPDRGRGRSRVDFAVEASRRLTIILNRDAAPGHLGARIEGSVHTPDGSPLPDVLVFATPRPDNAADPREQLHPSGHGTSDAAGRFFIESLDAGPHALLARVRGYAAAREQVSAPATQVTLTLGPEALLEGRVLDADTGASLAASTVVVERVRGRLHRRVMATATTFGADGEFVVRGLSPGTYEISATAHGYAASGPRPVLVQSTQPARVSLTLGRGGTIAGQVVTGVSGPALPGARVTLEGRMGGDTSAVPILVSATTDPAGRFTLTGVPTGSQSLFAAGEGHHGRVISGLTVAEGAALEVTIDLTPTDDGEEPGIELTGIGCALSVQGDGLIVGFVVPEGGAAEAGLAPDDVILAIDGVRVADLGFAGAIARIRGPEGSTLMLHIRRAGGDAEEDVTVMRKRIRA